MSSLSKLVLGFSCALGLSGVAHAQTSDTAPAESSQALEEVIVTAERRTSDVQKTATSVSVRSGDELAQQGRRNLTDILRDIPGLSGGDPQIAPSGGSETRGGGIVIRGISGGITGGGAGGTISGSSTTAVYVDGVYEGIGSNYDIERVEVLRGPQGTLYGRSATSGVVASYTRNPTFDDVNGFGTVLFGNYSRRDYTGAINIPLSDTFAVRASANKSEGTGYFNGDGRAYDFVDGRIKALYQPTEDFSVLLGMAFEEHDQNTGGCIGTSPALGVIVYTTCNAIEGTHNHSRQYWLDVKWDLGSVALYYQPALRTFNLAGAGYTTVANGAQLRQVLATPHDQFITQELRLASNTDSRLSWQTGLFHYWNNVRTENNGRYVTSGALSFDTPSTRDTKNYGIFGEGTFAFTDATRFTLGLRYDYTRVLSTQAYTRNLNSDCQNGSTLATCTTPTAGFGLPELLSTVVADENSTPSGLNQWRKVNYKVRLEHDLGPQNLLYGMVSTGFIPGDVTIRQAGVAVFDAETLTAYEIGSKNRFLDNRLQINGDVFFYDYGGLQQSVDVDPNLARLSFRDTFPAQVRGLEFELVYQLTAKDRTGLSYAYQDCRYVNKPARFATNMSFDRCARMGNFGYTTRINAPSTINAYYEHVFALPGGSAMQARIDGNFHSRYRNFNPSNTVLSQARLGPSVLDYYRMPSGAVGNASVNWNSPNDRFSVGAYVNNFTDKQWFTYEVFSLNPPNPRNVLGYETDPRTYGVFLTARF